MLTVRTSESGWLAVLAKAYKDQVPLVVIDDAKVGIDPSDDTLFAMAGKAQLSTGEVAAACVAIGMSAAGVGVMVLAFLDPEPTSKLGLLVAAGAAMALTGGLSAIAILTKRKPPKVTGRPDGFTVEWD